MNRAPQAFRRLSTVPEVSVKRDVPLASLTRFGIGGPADLLVETGNADRFFEALHIAKSLGLDTVVIGAGTNLIVADEGFRGVVLKLTNDLIRIDGDLVYVEGGAVLQHLVDTTVAAGLKGLETMTGIPGLAGAAIYGNAGAYGHSIMERIVRVRFHDGERIREFNNAECQFRYRESVFKSRKDWIIISADLAMEANDAAELRTRAESILTIRNRKYPPTMKCAGSIFKNFLISELPAHVVAEIPSTAIIEGKVPSAWFLEQVGAKGMRQGDIQVADYHANLIYNDGKGTARDLVSVISELKRRVEDRWDIRLEEEVQYVGLPGN